MKKLYVLAWLMMLSIVAMAQTIVVVNKDGSKATYDPSEVTSIDFQSTPPGFTVNWNDASRQYSFNEVQSVKGLPDYLFVDPKVVHVSLASTEGYEAMFAAEVKTNVEYDVETSDPWIKVARKEADRLVCNVLKHEGNDRMGYVALASKDGLLTDTIKVSIDDEFYVLKCLTPVQSITTVGTAQFMLVEIVNGALRPAAGKTISFSPENGTCSVKEAVTDAKGMVSVDFTPSSDADRGRVQASFRGHFNGISMMYTTTALFAVEKFELRCQPKQYFWKDGAVTVEFQLMECVQGIWQPVRATDVNFTCENGTLNAQSKKTDEEGKVTVDFAPDKNFMTGSVTASCKVRLIGGSYWFGSATTEVIKGEEYMLEALTPYVNLCGDYLGETPVQFRLLKYDFDKFEWEPFGGWTIKFTAENGVTGSNSEISDVDGIVTVTFQPVQGFVEGSLTASCDIDLPDGNKWHGEAVTKFMTDLYKIERKLPSILTDAVDYYIGKPWDCEFQLLKKEGNDYVPCPYQYIQFETTHGSCTPDYALTDTEGKVRTTYTMDDDKDVGTLKASFSFTDAEGNVCIGSVTTYFFLNKYDLQCLTPEVEIKKGELADIRFQLLEYKGKGKWEPCPDKKITFTAQNGSCAPEWMDTNENGIAMTNFEPAEDATYGTVEGVCKIILDPTTGLDWRSSAPALVTIIDDGTGDRPSKEKAKPKIRILDEGSGGTKPQVVDDNGNGEIVFVVEERIEGEDADRPVEGATVEFETDSQDDNLEGFSWATTGKDGKAPAIFKVKDFAKFKGVKIKAKATVKYSDGEKIVETTAKVNSDGTLDTGGGGGSTPCDTGDDDLNKADLQENTYVIKNKRTGETETRTFTYKWSEYSQNSESVSIMLEDADANGGTQGMVYGFLPLTMKGVVAALTGQTFENTPGAKIGFELFAGGKPIMGSFAKFSGEDAFGSMKPESKVLLREPCNNTNPANSARRAPGDEEYTGDYEFLFYFVFTNEAEENGDEYEVYGKGTMHVHTPTLYYFDLDADKDWVRVGESTQITLVGYREEGATWDWNDVEIVGQASNYNDAYSNVNEGYFTWDVATQTLTSVKSNDNKDVYIAFALKSNPEVKCVISVATGEGWKYTMIKTSVEAVTYTGYGYMSFSFDWTPKESDDEKFDFNALEIDPSTNPNGYFSIPRTYAPQGWPLYVNSDTPAGEYTVRFWIKSNHDVNCTLKVISNPEQ